MADYVPSLVLNPKSRHYGMLKSHLQGTYHDDYWPADAIVMELNSRDFASRVDIINGNTRAVCHFLRSRALSTSPDSRFAIKDVFYPEWMTRANYDQCRRPGKDDNFGPLFSLTFVTAAASVAFYDALGCAKGPSLGTNFTLSCPYTLLAHYHELDWAASYGVDEGIVRVSVGMENRTALLELFKRAVEAAEATLSGSRS
jgi:cystathionine gamma-synthase